MGELVIHGEPGKLEPRKPKKNVLSGFNNTEETQDSQAPANFDTINFRSRRYRDGSLALSANLADISRNYPPIN